MTIPAELQRWKRHRLVNTALLLSCAAGFFGMLALVNILLPLDYQDNRGNPAYWVLLLPAAGWAMGVVNFHPWAVRGFRPFCVALGACSVAMLVALERSAGTRDSGIATVLAVASVVAGLAAWILSSRPAFMEFAVDVRRCASHRSRTNAE